MIWMLRSKPSRYAVRVDVAVTVAELRRQLVIVRDVTESGKAGPDTLNAVRLHAKPTQDHFLTTAMRLPRMERELAFRWDHAAAMTYWYLHGDRGFAPLEEQAAALLASLPDGVDTAAAEAIIAAIHDRTETPILRVPWRGTTDRDRTPDEVDQQGLQARIFNDRTRVKFDEILDPDSANSRRAARDFVQWLDEALDYLAATRTHEELEAVAGRWRSARNKYIHDNPHYADVVIRPQS